MSDDTENIEAVKAGRVPISTNEFLIRVAALTMAAMVLAVVLALVVGLFSIQVDNKEIFGVIGPAF